MKKLKLNLQNMEGVELLTRAQLKNVIGGTVLPPGDGDENIPCTSDLDCGIRTKYCEKDKETKLHPYDVLGYCPLGPNSGPNYGFCRWTLVC